MKSDTQIINHLYDIYILIMQNIINIKFSSTAYKINEKATISYYVLCESFFWFQWALDLNVDMVFVKIQFIKILLINFYSVFF